MTKPRAYPLVVAARLTVDVAAIAPQVVGRHEELIAQGYKLRSPVVVNMRRDGTVRVRFAYRGKCATETWYVTAYAGWLFGQGLSAEEPAKL